MVEVQAKESEVRDDTESSDESAWVPDEGVANRGNAQNACSKAGVRSDFWRSSGREEGGEEGEEGVSSSGERNRTRERERERWIAY